MSSLAPGRTYDIAKLLAARSDASPYSDRYNQAQAKIYDLIEEAKCPVVVKERWILVKASIAHDEVEVENCSRRIEEHVKSKHPRRFYRAWSK